jgi:hypothetical protein
MTGTIDKIAESTASRALSRLAIIVMVPLLGVIASMIWHEVSLLEESSKVIWAQIAKMNTVQSDTVNKLAIVGTQFTDHQKEDDKFDSNVAESLKGIAAQIRDITVSSARVAPTVTPAPVTPPPKP